VEAAALAQVDTVEAAALAQHWHMWIQQHV